ncbi:MAG: YicC/YloC family endoribonuclease, partial [Bacteroidales bacterium]
MTGFGKAECVLPSGKYLIEIRSLNGKNCDITLKTSLIPRDKEMELRQMITDRLNRGTVDIFITAENNTAAGAKVLNKNILLSYYRQVQEAKQGNEMADLDDSSLLETLLRMPDIFVNDDQELTDDMWGALKTSFNAALDHLDEFRATEGKRLYDDVLTRVTNIESYVGEVDKYEHERVDTVRKKLDDGIAELKADPDKNRLE